MPDDIQGRATTSSVSVGYRKNRQIFTAHQEQQLRDYTIKASDIYYGLSPKEVCTLAYQFSVSKQVKIPQSWSDTSQASADWISGFIKHHSSLSIDHLRPQAWHGLQASTGRMLPCSFITWRGSCRSTNLGLMIFGTWMRSVLPPHIS